MRDGGYRERQGIELSDRIANENGRLVVSLTLSQILIPLEQKLTNILCLVCLVSTIEERWTRGPLDHSPNDGR